MYNFKLFQMHCFTMDGEKRVTKTVYINPTYVTSVELHNGVTKVITTTGEYYTLLNPELIIEGLKNIQEINNKIVIQN